MPKQPPKSKIWLEDYTAVFSKLSKAEIEQLIAADQDIPVEDVFNNSKTIIPNQVSSIEDLEE